MENPFILFIIFFAVVVIYKAYSISQALVKSQLNRLPAPVKAFINFIETMCEFLPVTIIDQYIKEPAYRELRKAGLDRATATMITVAAVMWLFTLVNIVLFIFFSPLQSLPPPSGQYYIPRSEVQTVSHSCT